MISNTANEYFCGCNALEIVWQKKSIHKGPKCSMAAVNLASSNLPGLLTWQSYGTGKKKRLIYLVGNLVATNWPIEKALHAIGYNQIPTK